MPENPISKLPAEGLSTDSINAWFDGFMGHIQADHVMLTSGTVTEDTKKFYTDAILGNAVAMAQNVRGMSSRVFIQKIVGDYLQQLKSYNKNPVNLSMALSDSKILVWAVIEDDDEETEDALLLSEAKVNGKYYQYGFYLNSTIVEKSDNMPTPPHYHPIIE